MNTAVDDLVDAVARLWPDSSDVRVRPRGATPPDASSQLLLAVPSMQAPRLLIPSHRRAAAAAVRRFSCSVTPREVLQRLGMAAALRLVGPARLLGGLEVLDSGIGNSSVGSGGGDITDHLAEVLGQPVVVSLGIGTRRANRKAVLQVFDATGRPIAHAKVGDTPIAAGHVRGEAENLRLLEGTRWDRVRIPRLLHHGTWSGSEVLVLSSLPASPWQFGPRRRIPMGAVEEVARSASGTTAALVELPSWSRWSDSVSALRDVETRDRLRAAMDRVADLVGDEPVRCGAWHGDFTPWNMGWSGATLSLWDWERYETGVPVGLDVVHHAVNVRVAEIGFTDVAVRAGLDDARGLLDGDPTAPTLLPAYLVAIAVRYLAAAELEGGEVIRNSGLVALGELERHGPSDGWRAA